MDVEHLWHYEQSGGPSSRKARTAAELALLANTAEDSSSSTNQDFLQVRYYSFIVSNYGRVGKKKLILAKA